MALPANISKDFIDDILKPYRKHAQYLKSAELTHFQDKCSCATKGKDAGLITAKGRFSIPESCYIDDTGHFNAVEFNICFNQLAYVAFGKCLEANILKNLRLEGASVSFGDFKRHSSRCTRTSMPSTSTGKRSAPGRKPSSAKYRVTTPLTELSAGCVRQHGQWTAEDLVEPLRTADGRAVGAIVRRKETVCGDLEVSGELLGDRLFKITVRVSNVTPAATSPAAGRDALLMQSLVSTHAFFRSCEASSVLSIRLPNTRSSRVCAAQHRSLARAGRRPVRSGCAAVRRRSSCKTTRRSRRKARAISATGPRLTKCWPCGS